MKNDRIKPGFLASEKKIPLKQMQSHDRPKWLRSGACPKAGSILEKPWSIISNENNLETRSTARIKALMKEPAARYHGVRVTRCIRAENLPEVTLNRSSRVCTGPRTKVLNEPNSQAKESRPSQLLYSEPGVPRNKKKAYPIQNLRHKAQTSM